MRSVNISATDGLLVERERSAVDLRLRQRSEHLRERDGIPHRVRHDTFDSSAPVVSEAFTKTFAAPKRVNLDLLRSQDEQLHAFTGLRPEDGVAPALEGE